MSTIYDIKFNDQLFSNSDCGLILLYEKSIPISVPVSRPDILTFIKTFDSTSICEQYITTNSRKQFILFVYSENMVSWLKDNTKIPENLAKIIIFCALNEDKFYLQRWRRRYSEKVKKIVTFIQLEYELLIFGIEYIQNLFQRFKKDPSLSRLLEENYQQLRSGLMNYFDKAISNTEN